MTDGACVHLAVPDAVVPQDVRQLGRGHLTTRVAERVAGCRSDGIVKQLASSASVCDLAHSAYRAPIQTYAKCPEETLLEGLDARRCFTGRHPVGGVCGTNAIAAYKILLTGRGAASNATLLPWRNMAHGR